MAALVVADAAMRQRARAGELGVKTLAPEAELGHGKRAHPNGTEEGPTKKMALS